jgi:hypothetical protein
MNKHVEFPLVYQISYIQMNNVALHNTSNELSNQDF